MPDYAVTLPRSQASIQKHPNQSLTHKFKIRAADVAVSGATAATDTVTIALGSTPAGNWAVTRAFAVINTAFAGTTALTLQVGTTGTLNAFLPATSVLSGSHIIPTGGFFTTNTPASSFGTSSVGLAARFTNATGGSPSAVTAGDVDVYITLTSTSQLDGAPL